MTGEHAERAFSEGEVTDFEQVSRVVGAERDAFAVEIVVEVLDLLVAREEVHRTRARGGVEVILDVGVDEFVGHVGGHHDIAGVHGGGPP